MRLRWSDSRVVGCSRGRCACDGRRPRRRAARRSGKQKLNYHVKTLEQHGLVELLEERRKGNLTERVVQASAVAYVISPAALAAVSPDPAQSPDRLSARWYSRSPRG
jgi:hypothetical protein